MSDLNFNNYSSKEIKINSLIREIKWEDVKTVKTVIDDKILVVNGMPFNAYIIPRECAKEWCDYCLINQDITANTVYILYGYNFIYVGKAINGDRIIDHIKNIDKKFDYQMVFVPNKNSNIDSRNYWDNNFMEAVESELINKIKNSQYCNNKINGIDKNKTIRNMGYHQNKQNFINEVVDDIIAAFKTITFMDYLLDINTETAEEENNIVECNESNTNIDNQNIPYRYAARQKFFDELLNAMYDDERILWKITNFKGERVDDAITYKKHFNTVSNNSKINIVYLCQNQKVRIEIFSYNIDDKNKINTYISDNNIQNIIFEEAGIKNKVYRWKIEIEGDKLVLNTINAVRTFIKNFENL